jgi:ABC-type dipeptide/oligopeptide/nickel transport system permease subunit
MVEMVKIRQEMWVVMLESAKDRVLGVDTLGQQMSSRVRYGTACLLIMAAIGCESCSVVWGKARNVI